MSLFEAPIAKIIIFLMHLSCAQLLNCYLIYGSELVYIKKRNDIYLACIVEMVKLFAGQYYNLFSGTSGPSEVILTKNSSCFGAG